MNYRVTVIDPGATLELYPQADAVIPEFADRAISKLNIGKGSSIVIVTKHKYDEPALRSVVALNAGYIGLVSSYRRASALFKEMI